MKIVRLKAKYDGKTWDEGNVSATFHCEGLTDKQSGDAKDAAVYADGGALQGASLLKVKRGVEYLLLEKPSQKSKTGRAFKLLAAEVAAVLTIKSAVLKMSAGSIGDPDALIIAGAIYSKHA
jgi:hypothetical protein